MDEIAIIDRFFRPLAGEGAFGLRDDAGRLAVPEGRELVVTADMIASGVHFLPGDPPDSVARKALRVNLSDLAAKGAEPLAYMLSLGLSAKTGESWLTAFAAGLAADQERYGIALLGGDTIGVPAGTVISVTAFGTVPRGRMVHRFGGHPGDALYVSGAIGGSTAGLALLQGRSGPWDKLGPDLRADLVARYRVPQPRTALSPALAAFASAAMDVSDGLVGDCDKLAAASGCAARIDADAVPLAVPLERGSADLAALLTGGEDFEILAAVTPRLAAQFAEAATLSGVNVTRIGALTAGHGPTLVTSQGRDLALGARAYVHNAGGRPPLGKP